MHPKKVGGTHVHTDIYYSVFNEGQQDRFILSYTDDVKYEGLDMLRIVRELPRKLVNGRQPGELCGPPLRLNPAEVFPAFRADFIEFDRRLLNRRLYMTVPQLIYSIDPAVRQERKAAAELKVLFCGTVLRHKEHPNIVKYHGCIAVDGRVTGLVLDRIFLGECLKTLYWRCQEKTTPLDVDAIVGQVRRALNHLNTGLYVRDDNGVQVQVTNCHNDIHMHNIMLTKDGDREVAVLIEFYMCVPAGQEYLVNGAFVKSSVDNDWSGLQKVEDELREAFPGSGRTPSAVGV